MPPPPIDILGQGIHSAPDEDNICLICHDVLAGDAANPPYRLECGHAYHAGCIVTWFRTGHMNCPYCGDTGVNAPKPADRTGILSRSERTLVNARCSRLRQYARRKDAPLELVRMVERMRGTEQEIAENARRVKEFKNSKDNGMTWRELDREYHKLRRHGWALHRRAREQASHIAAYPVVPLIIPRVVARP